MKHTEAGNPPTPNWMDDVGETAEVRSLHGAVCDMQGDCDCADEHLATLLALLAERDSLRNQRDQEQAWRERLQESELREHHKLLAAEARVEAAEQAVDSIIDLAQTFIMAGDRPKFLARVAALLPVPETQP